MIKININKLFFLFILFFFLINKINAATYYVRVDGNDSNNGLTDSSGGAWLTIQKAANTLVGGDTVLIGPGTYLENVNETTSGSFGSPITYKANGGTVILQTFRVNHAQYIRLDGLNLKFSSPDLLNAQVRIESTSHNLVITNCTFGPQPIVFGPDFSFHSSGNIISNYLVDWSAAGFFNGANIWIAGYTRTNDAGEFIHPLANGFKTYKIDNITGNLATLIGDSLVDETNWAAIYLGTQKEGVAAILGITSGGAGATNIVIQDSRFINIFGQSISLGINSDVLISNNVFNVPASFKQIIPTGTNILFVRNLFKDATNFTYWTAAEGEKFSHSETDGLEKIDWGFGQIHTGSASPPVRNLTFRSNWFQNWHAQFCQFVSTSSRSNLLFEYNVFVGIAKTANGAHHGYSWRSNTFVQFAYENLQTLAVPAQSVNKVEFLGNVFYDTGYHASTNIIPYSIAGSTQVTSNYNYVAQAETLGFMGYVGFREVNGINGGDPIFVDINNPLGSDGLPFTEDDGLKPMPNSPIAIAGIGALSPKSVTNDSPLPHFIVSVVNPIWHDALGESFDSAWVAQDWWTRTNFVRPWGTPEAIGAVPCTVTFDASSSISGTFSTNSWYGINQFTWDFGDGSVIRTRWPEIEHTYLWPSNFVVKLTIENSNQKTSTITNYYRVLAQDDYPYNVFHVKLTGNDTTGTGTELNPWRTISKAISVVTAGDYVAVHSGDYDENPDINRDVATEANRITFIGYGAQVNWVRIRYPNYTWDGFDLSGENATSAAIFIFQAADNFIVRNNYVHDTVSPVGGVILNITGGPTDPIDGVLGGTIQNNFFTNIANEIVEIGLASNLLVTANQVIDTVSEGDFIKIRGDNIRVTKNYCRNLNNGETGGHADFFQVNQGDAYVKNIIIERNWVEGNLNNLSDDGDAAIGQMESMHFASINFTNFHIRNNVFRYVRGALSDSIDGLKVYNNLFYRSPRVPGTVTAGGGDGGSSYGTEFYNNIFFECGLTESSSSGFYYNAASGDQNSNTTVIANYNFVVGLNKKVKQVAPPNDFSRWAANGLEINGINGGNPMFLNAEKGDFRISVYGAVYRKGTNLTSHASFSDDFFGDARNSVWDIGPFQAGPSSYNFFKNGVVTGLRIISY